MLTSINALYVLTVKSVTDLFLFPGYSTRVTTYRFSACCLALVQTCILVEKAMET